jgi:putative transposase
LNGEAERDLRSQMESKFADIPNELWDLIQPVLPPEQPRFKGGRPPIDNRRALAGIVYRLRTGAQWKALPREFGSGSAVHRRFQAWVDAGVFRDIFECLVRFYNEIRGIDWRWASLDSAIVKAPKGGTRRGRTRPTARRAAASATL